ncbi:MAG TPA: DUF167 family protein [Kiloniellaceae bacterium]|nr:DUF167 family protein [Kiloniellaceae bacterium]
MAIEGRFFQPSAEGLRLAVRLQPGAGCNRIDGPACLGDGETVLKVRVTAVAEKGRANKALIALLAKSWRLPKSAFRLTLGAQDRRKVLILEGDTRALAAQLDLWCRDLEATKT